MDEGLFDAETDRPLTEVLGAICVQKLDDSRDSAIHIKYRISLRSSSLREPSDPLLQVVFIGAVPSRAKTRFSSGTSGSSLVRATANSFSLAYHLPSSHRLRNVTPFSDIPTRPTRIGALREGRYLKA